MNTSVDVVCFGPTDSISTWPLGKVWQVSPTPSAICEFLEKRLPASQAEAWLFWDSNLELPTAEIVQALLQQPYDLWHAGLLLGTKAQPGLIDFVHPTWMFNLDADPLLESTSWRLSLRACLIRSSVLQQLGFVRPEFGTLECAALEMGHRYIAHGALMRHVPHLLTGYRENGTTDLPFEDELRFCFYRFGRFWSQYAALRAILSRNVTLAKVARAWKVFREKQSRDPSPLTHDRLTSVRHNSLKSARVSVLIPTLDRYPYLRNLLSQLRCQTVPAHEIIIVDQTNRERRELLLAADFGDLPLRVIYQDEPGQCSSRNSGLQVATGDYILFVDDDDEVPPSLIESHLKNLEDYSADVSSGVAEEVGGVPERVIHMTSASDVFPTNNTLIRRGVLLQSGLFDLAYNRGQRADGDLGMRVYLSGASMILDSRLSVLHHHAPSGGLRAHNARAITYASSRQRITHRQVPSATDIYLAMRYFTPRQKSEMLWHGALGTFSVRGSAWKKLLKIVVSAIYLPQTVRRIRVRLVEAKKMMTVFPQIAALPHDELSSTMRVDSFEPKVDGVRFQERQLSR
jgi:glycosyltransferase involved in cell wall biosynthesis